MTQKQNNAFVAGLVFGVALFVIRLSAARTWEDVLFAAALTLAEFSIVWLWEKKARQLGQDRIGWSADEEKRSQSRGLANAAKHNLRDRQDLLDEAKRERSEMECEFERDHLMSDLKTLITIATNAVRGGYYGGISANAGAVSGATSLEEMSNAEH